MTAKGELSVETLVEQARLELGMSREEADALRPILDQHAASINRLRGLAFAAAVEPDCVFLPEQGHE